MDNTQNYFRPNWTCGKYNKSRRTAIMYNLVEGTSHFFEEDSADVIGQLLQHKRLSSIDINLMSNILNIEKESIFDFVDILVKLGLLTQHH